MNENQLVDGLVSLNGKSLRMVYSFLYKTKPQHVINKTKKDEMLRYFHLIEQEAENLTEVEDAVLQLDIWLQILKSLHIKINFEMNQDKITHLTNRIVTEVYNFYKRDENFEKFVHSQGNNDRLTTILLYEIKLQIQRFSKRMKKENVNSIHIFMNDFKALIESIPENEATKKSLEMLDNPKFEDIIITTLNKQGIKYYRDILQLIWRHGVSMGIFNEQGDSEMEPLYIMMSPLFIAEQVEPKDLRSYLQIEYFRKNLLPNLLLQLYISSLNSNGLATYDSIWNEWLKRKNQYKEKILERDQLLHEIADLDKELETNQMKLKDIYYESKQIGNQIKADKASIYNALKYADVTELDVNLAFEVHRREFLNIQHKMNHLLYEKHKHTSKAGIISKLKSKVSNVGTTIQLQNEKRKLDYYIKEMTEDLLASSSEFKMQERVRIKEAEKRLKELKKWQKQHQDYQKLLKADLTKCKARLWKVKREVKEFEKEYYGIKDTFTNSQKNYLEELKEDE
ncbi:hypothetical protein GGQ92_000620 [Gracilibacillus halotolerans]|uniref:Uncharacterized protein n=1 Tax=Gracilibacillus halotolerans TaxID=74386 RepID=A0A841RJN6_9BACI|nr:hypothetical protein [Gracilibacillus halotolerans]MBB6511853.1 hypothetical protein [Gracilibacillus halotolerans]